MTANDLLMQFQADVLDAPVVRPAVAETTCLGAAYAAGLAVGFWPDLATLSAHWREGRRMDTRHGTCGPRARIRPVEEGGPADLGLGGRRAYRLAIAPASGARHRQSQNGAGDPGRKERERNL